MSEVAANSEIQENCVQAKNDEVVEPVPANNSILKEASSAVVETTTSLDATAAAAAASEDEVGATPPKENAAETAATSPKVETKKTPVKRTPSKRMSFIERAQKESEELVKNLGGSLELEGGRRTRSSTRGTPTRSAVVATPPPAKKSRASPAASSSTAITPSRRGRGRKIDTSSDPTDVESTTEENKKTEAAEEATSGNAADNNDAEKSSVENAENSVVDAANTAAAAEEQEASETVKTNDDIKTNATASKSEDLTDAALESIPEEKQNNIDHNVSEERNDSPMDTDEEPKPVSDPETIVTATVEEVKEKIEPLKAAATISLAVEPSSSAAEATASVEAIEKQPTPEPMEVDSSSSKDNEEDIESAPNSAEDVEKESAVVVTDSSEASVVEIADPSECGLPAVEVTKTVEDKPSNTGAERDSVSGSVTETHNAEPTLVNDLKIAVTADVDPAAAGEPQATTNATLETTTDTTKSENDLCEPKIVSPPTTDGAVAATPQYCN